MEKKVYLANGLFSAGDRMFNDLICEKLEEAGIEYYAPQKNLAINDKRASATSLPIYEGDTEKLKWCNVLIAVLDGVSVDAGVASEVGWAAGWNENHSSAEAEAARYGDDLPEKKIILGLYTDNRDLSHTDAIKKYEDAIEAGVGESQWPYVNLYTVGCCKKWGKVFWTLDEVLEYLKTL